MKKREQILERESKEEERRELDARSYKSKFSCTFSSSKEQRNQLHSRLNLAELKAQLVKRLGLERTKLYFYYLNKFLSLKLSKVDFNKFCLRVIGRESVKLHNQLIRSILRNACTAKVPPSGSTRGEDGFEFTQNRYGDVSLTSPRGPRSGISVGSDGKVEFSSQQSTITGNNVVVENGDLGSHEIQKPVQHHQVISEETNNEGEVVLCHPAERKGSARDLLCVDSSKSSELDFGDGIELFTRRSLRAPLGITFCSFSVSGACQASHLASSGRCFCSHDSGGLFDTKTLRERMQQIATAQGLESVSMDCANLLNSGLDIYLKRLIRSTIQLVGTRFGNELMRNNANKHHNHAKLVNGVLPGYHLNTQSSSRPLEEMNEHRHDLPITLLDFKVAMWMKPHQLGEDWPLQLEKICTHSHED